MQHFTSPTHLHGIINLQSGSFTYLFAFASGETYVLKKEYRLLGREGV
jgi:hypothetical protein